MNNEKTDRKKNYFSIYSYRSVYNDSKIAKKIFNEIICYFMLMRF